MDIEKVRNDLTTLYKAFHYNSTHARTINYHLKDQYYNVTHSWIGVGLQQGSLAGQKFV